MTAQGKWQKDKVFRQIVGVSSLPTGSNAVLVSHTSIPGNIWTVNFQVSPSNRTLSLWNFAASLVVDDNTTFDSTGQFANLWPTGSGITTEVGTSIRREDWFDWALSSDEDNERVYVLRIENLDTVDHTFYVYFKAYTQSSNPGSS